MSYDQQLRNLYADQLQHSHMRALMARQSGIGGMGALEAYISAKAPVANPEDSNVLLLLEDEE